MKVRAKGDICISITEGTVSALTVEDEGNALGDVDILNFVGAAVTVSKVGNTATINITGGSSSSPLIDWPIASGAPTGISKGTRYYLTGSPGTILGEDVVQGTTMEARIDSPIVRSDWYINMGGT